MYLFWSLVVLVWTHHTQNLAHDDTRLVKRATVVGTKAFEGLKAIKYLLKDSKPLEGEMKFMSDGIKEFKKSSPNADAYVDFWALKPKHIRGSGPLGSSITFGRVGDRVVIFNEKGIDDMPTIEIFRDSARSHQSLDANVIYYK